MNKLSAAAAAILATLMGKGKPLVDGPSKKSLRRVEAGIVAKLWTFAAGTGECAAKGCKNEISVDHDGTCVRFCSRAHRHLRHNRNGLRAQKYAARAARRAA